MANSKARAAGAAPRGAHWIRASLQVNPYGYKGTNQPSTHFKSEADYNKALLDECHALGISLLAITDHWCVDSAAALITDATSRGIVALPGFEANTSEGVHLLVIFEVGTELSTVNAAIGACGAAPGCDNGTTGHAFKDILKKMSERGALVIPAHVNVAKGGMLTSRSGQPLVEMVTDEHLHAIAVSPGKPAGTDQPKIIKNLKPYERKHPLAVIYSDDIMEPTQLKQPGGSSWFKVSSSCLESLKLAVRTPQTRVALKNPAGVPRTLIREVSWTGGFLDGVTLPVASDLTTLIGGRGTGKSTVIESLRYALDSPPLGVDAAKDHKAIVDNVLRSGTIVKVEVDTVSPTPRSFTIERVVPDPPVVRDSAGVVTNQRPVDVVGSVEVFGQHELAELAGDSTSVADMIQRFAGSDGIASEHEDVLDKLAENRAQLGKAEEAWATLKEELDGIPRLEEQVKQYTDTKVAERLAALKRIEQDEAMFAEAKERVDDITEAVADLVDAQLEAALDADYEELDNSPQKKELEAAAVATKTLATALQAAVAGIQAAVATAEAEIASAKKAWETAVAPQRKGHAEVLRKLNDEGLEPDKYLQTSKALDTLKAKQPRLKTQDNTIASLKKQRVSLLKQLAGHQRTQLEALHKAVKDANAATNGVVVVRPVPAPDRYDIIEVVEGYVSGQRTQIVAAISADDFSIPTFLKAIRGGVDELEKLGIKKTQANGLINARESLQRELEELSVGHAVEVLLRVESGTGQTLKTMDELSKGQRATALLLLLLGASTAPLVIDQPEDDLDNRFIYDGVVTRLRELKGHRQIIASTHNANVPVLGDAELIVALEGDGQHGKPVDDGVGSLDDATIRGLAENILEGGPAAFNARQHLYGF